jgi:hypothetical protein
VNLKRTRNKLLKNGFIPTEQSDNHDRWTDIQKSGTDISFLHDGESRIGSLRVHGNPGLCDRWLFCPGVKMAIQVSRV